MKNIFNNLQVRGGSPNCPSPYPPPRGMDQRLTSLKNNEDIKNFN